MAKVEPACLEYVRMFTLVQLSTYWCRIQELRTTASIVVFPESTMVQEDFFALKSFMGKVEAVLLV